MKHGLPQSPVITRRSQRGFSLVELVVVVVIMGTVAAIALPRMSQATANATAMSLRANLRILNTAAETYATEHEGLSPAHLSGGSVDSSARELTYRLTRTTDITGQHMALVRPFGPYLNEIPRNPMNGLSTVRVDGAATRQGLAGWRFDSATNTFMPDHLLNVVVKVDGGQGSEDKGAAVEADGASAESGATKVDGGQ